MEELLPLDGRTTGELITLFVCLPPAGGLLLILMINVLFLPFFYLKINLALFLFFSPILIEQ